VLGGGLAEAVAICVNVLGVPEASDVGVLLAEEEGAGVDDEDAEVEDTSVVVLDPVEELEDDEELLDDVDKELELEVNDADEAERGLTITGVVVGVADDAVFAAEEALRLVCDDGVAPGITPG